MAEVLKVLIDRGRSFFPYETASAQAALKEIQKTNKPVYEQILDEAYERRELAPEEHKSSYTYLTLLLLQVAHKRGLIAFVETA